MSDTYTEDLGLNGIVSNTFSTFVARIVPIALLTLVVSAISVALTYVLTSSILSGSAENPFGMSAGAIVTTMIVPILIWAIQTAILSRLAYDHITGDPIELGSYLGQALVVAVPLIIVSIIIGIAAGLGFIFLIVPGLYLSAMFFVTTPSLIIERNGFSSIGRSVELTKGYRWSIVLVLLIFMVISMAVNFPIEFMLTAGADFESIGKITVGSVIGNFLSNLVASLSAISAALVYARLREIKEGVSVKDLADVFD